MGKFRAIAAVFIILCVNTGILALTYPIWRELRYKRYPGSYWMKTYAYAGMLSTGIVFSSSFAVWLAAKNKTTPGFGWYGGTAFAVLSIAATYVGVSQPYPRGQLASYNTGRGS